MDAGQETALAPLQERPNGRALVPPKKNLPAIGGPIDLVCRALKGGKTTFMELARLSPNIEPGMARLVEEWDHLTPAAQKKADLDRICQLVELDPGHVMAVVGEAAVKFRDNASVIIAAMTFPEVVEKSVKVALTTEGWRDRKHLMEHARFLPVNTGTRIGIGIKNTAAAASEATAESATAGAGRGLPTHEQTIAMCDEAIKEEGL